MIRLAALLLALTLLAGAAVAADNDALFALYAKGDYAEAARAGAAAHTAYGYALAARAILAEEVLGSAPCLECLQRAEAVARQAVAADPKLADGQIWLAVALGYESRITGIISARLHRRPEQARDALEAAVKADPHNPYAVSALGGWHVEVVKGAGPFLARRLYSATIADGVALYDRAVKLEPNNVAVHYQIALSLAGYDVDKWGPRVAQELDDAIKAAPQTAYERAMQARAIDLKAMLGGDRLALDAKVRKLQGYP
jgi:hypothetical protein